MSIIIDIMTNVKIFVDKQYQYYYNINPSLLITTTVAIHDQYPLWIFKIHIHQYPWMSSTCSSKLSRNGACPTAFLLPAMSNTNKPFVGIGLAKLKLPMTITKGQLAFCHSMQHSPLMKHPPIGPITIHLASQLPQSEGRFRSGLLCVWSQHHWHIGVVSGTVTGNHGSYSSYLQFVRLLQIVPSKNS